MVSQQALVPHAAGDVGGGEETAPVPQTSGEPGHREDSLGHEPKPIGCLCDLWEARQYGEAARDLIQASWWESTEGRYRSCGDHWTD